MNKLLDAEESGQGMAEYLLIVGLVAIGSIAAFQALGNKMSDHGNGIVIKVSDGIDNKTR